MAISHYTLLNIHKDNTECRGAQNPQSELGYIAPDSLFVSRYPVLTLRQFIYHKPISIHCDASGTVSSFLRYENSSRPIRVQEKGLWGTNSTPKRVRYKTS